jgi:uncharacterized protein (DUF1697 family)
MVALLRAVNVGGRKLPMAELRALCATLGWTDVETYIQSGNIVFAAPGTPAALEKALEAAIEKAFGFAAPAMVRTRKQWAGIAADCAFPDVARDAPNRLVLLLAKARPAADAAALIQARARHGETVKRAGDALWIHFPNGQGDSKLTPAAIDKACGAPATGRNYRTVTTLLEMLGLEMPGLGMLAK